MTGTHITFSVNDADVRAMLERQAEPGTGRLVPRLGEYLQASTKERFKTEIAPDGTPWEKLKTATIRRKKYNPDKVLTLRGYLRGSIRWQELSPGSVAVGTNMEYAAIHQFGGDIQQPARQATVRYRSVAGRVLFAGRKHKRATEHQVMIPAHTVKMPARPYLGISAQDDREILEIIRDYVVERNR